MLGAIIGDMVGSLFEFNQIKTKEFNIFDKRMRMTDDSLLTIAMAKVLMNHYPIKYDKESLEAIQNDLVDELALTWKRNQHAGFGMLFRNWARQALKGNAKPYNSFGNGSAMRISPVAWVADTEEHLKLLSKKVTEITHNHPEGIKGAEAVALSIYLALHGSSKGEITSRIINDYYPEITSLNFNDLVENYGFHPICQESVPQAIFCFLISDSVEDAIRNCIAIGGDCDTTAAMAGAIAEAYYSKEKLSDFEDKYMYLMIDPEVEKTTKDFHKMIGSSKFEKGN